MNLLSDVITYIRRIIKSPSDTIITDALIIDYINRFWIMDVDARMQLFDLKKKYSFQTQPGVDQYNMPLYDIQIESGNQTIGMYPIYQGFLSPAYINGVPVVLQTQRNSFFNYWPNIVQNLQAVAVGDGSTTNFNLSIPIIGNTPSLNPPINGLLRGHVDMSGIIATGTNVDPPIGITLNTSIPSTSIEPAIYITSLDSNGASIVVTDSGQFLSNVNYGLLMKPGTAPFGYSALSGGYSTSLNTINYLSGDINVTFSTPPADGANINVQCYFFQSGLPRAILFYNNVLTLRSPPSQQFLVELDAYLSPSAFLSSNDALQFGYMAEYLARGAARKILSDTGDVDQFQFYEPLFREQELLVWKRSQRQWTATKTQTLYSQGPYTTGYGNNNLGGAFL